MEDNLRTAIQDYLEDYVYVDAEKTEDLAEILYNYLAERGWLIIDTIGSFYSGGLPLGAGPITTSSPGNGWSWDFIKTENLFVTDIIPK